MPAKFDGALKIVLSQPRFHLSIIEELLQNGADPKIKNHSDYTILELAAKNQWDKENYLKLIEMCVATQKLSANDFSYAFGSYLSYAHSINLDVVQAFFNAGASPNKRDNREYTILGVAAKSQWDKENYLKLIEMCVATQKLSANDFSYAFGSYLSHAHSINLDIVQAFFNAGASPNKRNNREYTILELAAKNRWDPNSFSRLIQMVSKAPATLQETFPVQKRDSAEQILAALRSDKINDKEMASLGKQALAKEKLLQYISTCPKEEKQKLLGSAFDKNSNINRFFAVKRGLFNTRIGAGSFKTLGKMLASLEPLPSEASNVSFEPTADNQENGFICSITLKIMKDPVLCTLDGKSYERSAITEWLIAHRITPTRVEMGDKRIEDVLVPNRNLAAAIEYAKKEEKSSQQTMQFISRI